MMCLGLKICPRMNAVAVWRMPGHLSELFFPFQRSASQKTLLECSPVLSIESDSDVFEG